MDAPVPVEQSKLDRRWPFLSLIPIFGAWVPIYAGFRARRPAWVLAGIACTAIVLTGMFIPSPEGDDDTNLSGAFLVLGWIATMAVSFGLRGAFQRRMSSPWHAALEQGRSRLEQREAALRLVTSDPALAAEIGIGRPDRHDGIGAGLVDVNNASLRALLTLPRVDDTLATHIVEQRVELDGFASLEDLGAALDLGGSHVEALRGLVVFLPRRR